MEIIILLASSFWLEFVKQKIYKNSCNTGTRFSLLHCLLMESGSRRTHFIVIQKHFRKYSSLISNYIHHTLLIKELLGWLVSSRFNFKNFLCNIVQSYTSALQYDEASHICYNCVQFNLNSLINVNKIWSTYPLCLVGATMSHPLRTSWDNNVLMGL